MKKYPKMGKRELSKTGTFSIIKTKELIIEMIHTEVERNLLGALTLFTMEKIKPNYSELERKYGINRKTIRKYHLNQGKPSRKSPQRLSKLDPYKEEIAEKMKIPGMTYQAVYQYLKAKYPESNAFKSVTTFRWYVREKLKISKVKTKLQPHLRFETPPGKQLQVDWKEDITMISKHGELIAFNLMTATWGYSRLHLWRYSKTKTTQDFIRCLIDIFNQSGGIPQEVLTDNMSAVVSINGGKKRKHPIIIQFEKDCGFKLRLTKIRSPETKGKDESSNRFVQWLRPYNHQFENEQELITIIQKVNQAVNQQINQTTQLPPATLFRKEKETLSPLPPKVHLQTYLSQMNSQIVPATCLVRYQGSEYSVPVDLINKRVELLVINDQLYIYHNTKCVVIHRLSKQRFNYQRDHYITALQRHYHDEEALHKQVDENLKLLSKISKKGNNHE